MTWVTPVTAEGRSPAQSPAVSTEGGAGVVVPSVQLQPDPGAISGFLLSTQPQIVALRNGSPYAGYAGTVTASVVPPDVVISGTTNIGFLAGTAAFTDLVLGDGGDSGTVSIRFTLDNAEFVDSDPITVSL